MISLFLHISYNPYEDNESNYLERVSLLSACFIYFAGISFQMQGENSIIFSVLMTILLYSSLIIFFSIWLINMLKVIALQRKGLLKRLIEFIFGNLEKSKEIIKVPTIPDTERHLISITSNAILNADIHDFEVFNIGNPIKQCEKRDSIFSNKEEIDDDEFDIIVTENIENQKNEVFECKRIKTMNFINYNKMKR